MNLNKSANIFQTYGKPIIFKLICVAVSFVNSILINRSLGVALRGEYTLIMNWASFIQLFLNLGIGTAYPAFKRRDPEKSKGIFSSIVFVIAAIYIAAALILLPFVSVQLRYIMMLAVITTIENLLIFIAIVEDVTKRNIINVVTAVIHTAILLFIYINFKKNLDVVMLAVIVDHIVLCLSFVVLYRIRELDFKDIKFELIKSIFKIALPAMLMNMLMYLNYHADVLFLDYLTGDKIEVGLYGTAVTLGNMLWIIPDAFKDLIYNRASKKDNQKEIVAAIVCNLLICVVIFIGFVVLGKLFLRIMYGSDFVAAYSIVLLLFVGTLPMILYKLIHPIYIANGNTKTVVVLLGIAVGSNIVGNITLIPVLKGVGAAISSVISYSICGIAFFVRFQKDYSISFGGTITSYINSFVKIKSQNGERK